MTFAPQPQPAQPVRGHGAALAGIPQRLRRPGARLPPLVLEPRLVPADIVDAPPLAVVLVALALDRDHDPVVALALEVGVDVLPVAVLGDAATGVARVLDLVVLPVVPELGVVAAAVIDAGALAVPA